MTIGTNCENQGLDNPRFYPFYEALERHDIPVFLHPMIWHSYHLVDEDPAVMRLFGWPFDTTQAILRLVLSGTMERFPTLKVVTHHLGRRDAPLLQRPIQRQAGQPEEESEEAHLGILRPHLRGHGR